MVVGVGLHEVGSLLTGFSRWFQSFGSAVICVGGVDVGEDEAVAGVGAVIADVAA